MLAICSWCSGMEHFMSLSQGQCKICGKPTPTPYLLPSYELCKECSEKYDLCEQCGEPVQDSE